MPDAFIGDLPFSALYPNWEEILDELIPAVKAEEAHTPPEYLSDRERFYNFFHGWALASPHLQIEETSINDVFPFAHDECYGMGLLRVWLDDPDVEDIIMYSSEQIDVIKGGAKQAFRSPFADDEAAIRWMKQVMELHGQGSLSAHNCLENGQLPDGSRIICTIPPVARRPGFTIRKHRVERFNQDAYRSSGVAPAEFFDDLTRWVQTRENMLITGATSSGKTTMINYCGALIDPEDRIVVIEDTPELQFQHTRAYPMAARGSATRLGSHEAGDVTIAHLVAASLRMTPDRIILGEVRGPEAFDMLNAMNTGHDGGMTSLHANSPAEAVLRLESLASQARSNMPLWALQDLIANTVGIIVQMRKRHGTSERKVVEASQIFHPMQADPGRLDDPANVRLRENLIVRRLWLWNKQADRLENVAPMAALLDDYF